ncbi:MAG: hypothetical protein ABIO92_01790 [Chloroflexia bacterium]
MLALLRKGPKRGRRLGRGASLTRRIVAHTEAYGWREAVRNLLAAQHPDLFRYAADERASDWRFLLPTLPRGTALCAGGALSPVPLSLAATCERVVVSTHKLDAFFLRMRAQEEGLGNIEAVSYLLDEFVEQFDLVAGLRRASGLQGDAWKLSLLEELTGRVKAEGHLYLEIDHPAILFPPMLLRRRLKALGFGGVDFYWPKPTFKTCEMLIPLGNRRLQRYYLHNLFFAMSTKRRILRELLQLAVRINLFELTLPGYIVVAKRRGGGQKAG